MINLKYSINELLSFPLRRLLIIIMMSFVFAKLIPTLDLMVKYQEKINYFENLVGDRELFSLNNINLEENKNYIKDGTELINNLETKMNEEFIYMSKTPHQGGFIESKNFNFAANYERTPKLDNGEETTFAKSLEINKVFLKETPFEIMDGREFQDFDFDEEKSVVILGNAYKDYYSIGDKINIGYFDKEYLDAKKNTISYNTFEVIGINESQDFINYNSEEGIALESLDEYLIFPKKKLNTIPTQFFYFDYFAFLNTQQKKEISQQLLVENQRNTNLNVELVSVNSKILLTIEGIKIELKNQFLYFFILILFSLLAFIVVFSEVLKQRYKVFYVYLSVGARPRDLYVVNYICLALMTFLGLLLAAVYFSLIKSSFSPSYYIASFLLMLFIYGLSVTPSIFKVKTSNIMNYLKEVYVW